MHFMFVLEVGFIKIDDLREQLTLFCLYVFMLIILHCSNKCSMSIRKKKKREMVQHLLKLAIIKTPV